MARIASLFIHPVKSCAGLAPRRVRVVETGLEHDREWMVVDGNGRFVTQREEPRLALVRPQLGAGTRTLTLSFPGLEPLRVAVEGQGRPVEVTCWRSRCAAWDAGEDAASWLSAALGRPLRLVRFDPSRPRLSSRERTGEVAAPNLFSDGYPLLVLSQASLDDLNSRLERPLGVERFRPNLLIDGVEPYAEDRIREIDAGPVTLRLVKPCTRCVITTTDQSRGARDGEEPLRTLRAYRLDRELRGVVFGMNAIVARGPAPGTEAFLDCGQDIVLR